MKRLYVLAVVAALFAICEVKEIWKECPIGVVPWETIHIPHETNPHKFYKCVAGKKFEFTCRKNADPPFLLCYNPELEVCDWPWNVTACMDSTAPTVPKTPPTVPNTPPTVPNTPPTVPNTPPTVPNTPPTVPNTPPTVPNTPPTVPNTPSTVPTDPTGPTIPTHIPNPWNCPVNGKLPHPTNCKMYYDVNKLPVCCLENLVFNPLFCVCDLPINVPRCKPTPEDCAACGQ